MSELPAKRLTRERRASPSLGAALPLFASGVVMPHAVPLTPREALG